MHKDTKSKSYLHYYYFLIIIFYLSFGKCITLFPQGYWGRGFYSTAGYWNVKVMRNDFWIWTRTFYIRSISYTEQGRSISYLNLLDLKYLIIIIIIFTVIFNNIEILSFSRSANIVWHVGRTCECTFIFILRCCLIHYYKKQLTIGNKITAWKIVLLNPGLLSNTRNISLMVSLDIIE